MANEKDVVEPQQNNNNNNSSSNDGKVTEETELAKIDNEKTAKIVENVLSGATPSEYKDNTIDDASDERGDTPAVHVRAKLNDLVADLCLNGGDTGRPSVLSGGFGDYTNIRATVDYVEGAATIKSETGGDDNISPTNCGSAQPAHVQPPIQNSSFSFKHFLNSSNTMTAPSTTITSLDPVIATSIVSDGSNTTSTSTLNSLQTSTGARPKVPQVTQSISTTTSASMTSVIGALFVGGTQDTSANSFKTATKMKRSPRFSSFDSQASLAEFAGAGTDTGLECNSDRTRNDFYLFPDSASAVNSDFFPPETKNTNIEAINYAVYDRQYVPRSYSNYDMPVQSSSSPRHRVVFGTSKEARPTHLALNVNATKLKLDLPLDTVTSVSSVTPPARAQLSSAVDFQPAPSAAAVLPDFVQDHWMDTWYPHEMHVNSPSNSPVCDFGEDISNLPANNENAIGVNIPAGGTSNNNIAGVGGGVTTDTSVGSKMLPDFLSDGPIIHSSQRLADVAAGLPSVFGSPGDPPMAMQASHLRIENERLDRELSSARAAISVQTHRLRELEKQLEEQKSKTSAYKPNIDEEKLEKTKRRPTPNSASVTKLRQQVMHLTAEVEALRRENELLREEGAVGGCNTSNCNRIYDTAAAAARGRPSRTQQISRDLLRAASNAENNLRQLLSGVENLRRMAADIERSEALHDYDESPVFSDFLDDCDDYEEYHGGPAL